jgi:hypothetical protein
LLYGYKLASWNNKKELSNHLAYDSVYIKPEDGDTASGDCENIISN